MTNWDEQTLKAHLATCPDKAVAEMNQKAIDTIRSVPGLAELMNPPVRRPFPVVQSTRPYADHIVDATEKIVKPRKKRTNPEGDLTRDIVQALELKGYVVLKVGQWMATKSGTTPGCPDLLVGNGFDPFLDYSGVLVGLEVKTAKGVMSPAQQHFANIGITQVVRSVDEAIKAVEVRLK